MVFGILVSNCTGVKRKPGSSENSSKKTKVSQNDSGPKLAVVPHAPCESKDPPQGQDIDVIKYSQYNEELNQRDLRSNTVSGSAVSNSVPPASGGCSSISFDIFHEFIRLLCCLRLAVSTDSD